MRIIDGAEVDRRLAWAIGRAERLAKRGKLPHVVLPDGAIRFRWERIAPLVVERLLDDDPRLTVASELETPQAEADDE